jgi:NADPH-dependent curcumin reductase CurA
MSQSPVNRQWLLAARPRGRALAEGDFRYAEAAIPEPRDGEIVVRTLYLAFDPAQKGWMENAANYEAPMEIGDVMRGRAAGRVVASRAAGFAPGDLVAGMWGWQDYAALKAIPDPVTLEKLPADRPPSLALSALGSTAMTAYFGLLEIGKPVPGDTVVISGAAGATGSVAGQLAKIAGCTVVGIAGGAEKCAWLTRELGFDAAIDYRAEEVGKRLRALCPRGIDIFYDNVGGDILDAALGRLAMRGRVVLCGGISRYSQAEMPPGPANYFNLIFMRARMEGFIVRDYAARFPAAKERLWRWIQEGRLQHKEDVQEGFANIPRTLLRLFQGANFGKQLLKIDE